MNRVVKILMRRDNMTEAEALDLITTTKEDIEIAMEDGDYDLVEDIMMDDLGLEMDYIFDILWGEIMENKWLYDIFLNDNLIGDSGDLEFDTKTEAKADADDYILSSLCEEYKVNPRDFEIQIYQAQY